MEFVQQVESVFGFLREKGFSVPASETEDLFVRFQGTNVHIDLAYDFKDRVTDCTIGLVENGSPTAAWGKGLYAYLLEHKQFDQGLPDADPQYDEVTGWLMVYRELLLEHASELLNDDPTELRNYYEQERIRQEAWEQNGPAKAQHAADKATSDAGHAFKSGDYQKVVTLLQPHLDLISKKQKKKYETALARLNEQ